MSSLIIIGIELSLVTSFVFFIMASCRGERSFRRTLSERWEIQLCFEYERALTRFMRRGMSYENRSSLFERNTNAQNYLTNVVELVDIPNLQLKQVANRWQIGAFLRKLSLPNESLLLGIEKRNFNIDY